MSRSLNGGLLVSLIKILSWKRIIQFALDAEVSSKQCAYIFLIGI